MCLGQESPKCIYQTYIKNVCQIGVTRHRLIYGCGLGLFESFQRLLVVLEKAYWINFIFLWRRHVYLISKRCHCIPPTRSFRKFYNFPVDLHAGNTPPFHQEDPRLQLNLQDPGLHVEFDQVFCRKILLWSFQAFKSM